MLTVPGAENGRWDRDEFFATGSTEIRELLAKLDHVGLPVRYGAALDFGCGVGRLSQALASHFDHVVGVDIAPSMIELARSGNPHGSRCTFLLNESEDLRILETNSFDLVYSSLVLHHVYDSAAKQYIRDFVRLARPDGVVVFQVIDSRLRRSWRAEALRIPKELIRPLVNSVSRRLTGVAAFPKMEMHLLPRADVESVVSAAGATITHVEELALGRPNWKSIRYFVRVRATPTRVRSA